MEDRKKGESWPRSSNVEKFRDYFVREPRVFGLFGTVVFLLGTMGLFLSNTFASGLSLNWAIFVFSFLRLFGGVFMFLSSILTAPPITLVGMFLFALSLTIHFVAAVLFVSWTSTCTLWEGCPVIEIGILQVVAMVAFIAAGVLLSIQGIRDWKFPILGPWNYFAFASFFMCFAAGSMLCSSIRFFPGLTNYAPPGLEPMSSLLGCISGVLFLLSAIRSFNNDESILLFRFPSTVRLSGMRRISFFNIIIEVVAFFSLLEVLLSLLYGSTSSGGLWAAFSGVLLLCCVTLCSCVFQIAARVPSVLFLLSKVFQVASFALLAAFFGLKGSSNVLLLCMAVASFFSSVLKIIEAIRFFVPPATSFANIDIAPASLGLVGSVCLIVETSLAISNGILTAATMSLFVNTFVWLLLMGSIFDAMTSHYSYEVAQSTNFDNHQFDEMTMLPEELKKDDLGKSAHLPGVSEYDVIIVGGGPAGLTLAVELGLRGIKAILFEQRKTVVPDSRFFWVNTATMEGMTRNGVADLLIQEGHPGWAPWGVSLSQGMGHTDATIYSKVKAPGRDIMQEYGMTCEPIWMVRCGSSEYASTQGQRVVQSVQEACLYKTAKAFPCIKLMFGWKFHDFRAIGQGVRVVVAPSDSDEDKSTLCHVDGKILVACDGPAGPIGQLCKLRFDGFVKLHSIRSMYFKSPKLLESIGQNSLGLHHQYHAVVRDIGICFFVLVQGSHGLFTFHLVVLFDGRKPGELPEEEFPEVMTKFIGPDIPFEIVTKGRWMWNFCVARGFNLENKVLFCGDSCHSWPPFGGLAGNTAYQDTTNLAWKLAAHVKGWAGPDLLRSYSIERREQTMIVAMAVMGLTPEPSRLAILGKLLDSPLAWLVKAKWMYGNSGAHIGNRYALSGVSMGLRYSYSPVLVDCAKDIPPNDPACMFLPKLVVGGRVLHVKFSDGRSIQNFVDMNGLTLIVTSDSVSEEVSSLIQTFAEKGVPLSVADVSQPLKDKLDKDQGPKNIQCASRWIKARMVLCRPDLYISWIRHKKPLENPERLVDIVIGAASGTSELASEATCGLRWLTSKFCEETRPLRILYPKAVSLFNEPKFGDLKTATAKQEVINMAGEAQNIGKDGYDALYSIVQQDDSGFKCDFCGQHILQGSEVTINEAVIHQHCMADFRKSNTAHSCANCLGAFLDSSERVMYNGISVHGRCLLQYRATRTKQSMSISN